MNKTYPDQIREGGPNPLVYLVLGGPNLRVNMARRTNFTSGFGPAGPKIARTKFTVTPAPVKEPAAGTGRIIEQNRQEVEL